MTGAVLLRSTTHHGNDLFGTKWAGQAEAYIPGYGLEHGHGYYIQGYGHGQGSMHCRGQGYLHGHGHERAMCFSMASSSPNGGHGLHNFSTSDGHPKRSSMQHRNTATTERGNLIQLIQKCIQVEDLEAGRELHSLSVTSGLGSDAVVGSHLIRMFASFDSLLEARQVFSNLPAPNAFSWSAIISAHAKTGHLDQAFDLYSQMRSSNVQPDGHIFVAVLEACSTSASLSMGRLIHTHVLGCGYEGHIHVGNTLINMYGRCGNIEDACVVFQSMPESDVVTWNVLITKYTESGNSREALQIFQQMQNRGLDPDYVTYVCILKACSSMTNLEHGRMIHSQIIEHGLELCLSIGSGLIDMYGRCESLGDARCTFDRLPKQNVVVWSTMISAYVQHGRDYEAIGLLQKMQDDGIEPDWITFVCCLKAPSRMASLEEGKLIHACVVHKGMEAAAAVGSMLVDMYCKCGSLKDAQIVFNRLQSKDVIAWSTLISGYVENGQSQEAFHCFHEMQEYGILPDHVTYICILKGCSSIAALDPGEKIHTQIVETGLELALSVGNSLIDMYNKCGCLENACVMFDRLPERDVVTWNTLIDGYNQHGFGEAALSLFHQMHQEGMEPNLITFVCALKACSGMADVEQGRQIHAQFIASGLKTDPVISNTLLDMYSKCGSFEDARFVFDGMSKHVLVTWNTLIAGYASHECGHATLELFQQMQLEGMEPDCITFVCILKACSSLLDIEQGKQTHSYIVKCGLEMEIYVGNILISMYGKCGSIEDAHQVFDHMQVRDVVTWSALMTTYVHSGHSKETLQAFEEMQQEDIQPDQAAFVCALKACSNTAALEGGRTIHGHAIENGSESDLPIGTTLINMYGKCGSLDTALVVFHRLSRHSVVTYNAMLAACAEHGEYGSSIQLFDCMKDAGVKPNDVTFICLLSACRSLELVDEGCYHFASMRGDHGIVPGLEHYGCMVDILGHTGYLNEAEDLLETTHFACNLVGWTSLLTACRAHDGDVNLGKRCFDHAVSIDTGNAAVYVLMSNIYAHAGLQENAEKVERLRRRQNMWKIPGRAFIEIDKKVHEFAVGDNSHPHIEEIRLKVKALGIKISERVPMLHSKFLMSSISNVDKEDALCGHCEKLAIAFGLMSTNAGTTIRVAKNIRMCIDCHTATKITSLIERREIILTDSYRVHNFKDGACSCKD